VIEDRPERVDVRALVHARAAGLLRRHVRGRPHHRAVHRELRARARRGARIGGAIRRRAREREILGDAPVDHHRLAEGSHEHVVRLEITVDDAAAVRVRDGLRHVDDVGQEREALGERALARDGLLERSARDELHRVEDLPARPPRGVVERDDGRVLELRRDQRLAEEAGLGVAAAAVEQLLERHRPAEPPIGRAQDAPEAAARDLARDLVALVIAEVERELRRRGGRLDEAARERRGLDVEPARRLRRGRALPERGLARGERGRERLVTRRTGGIGAHPRRLYHPASGERAP
jgi:hypothetical protein